MAALSDRAQQLSPSANGMDIDCDDDAASLLDPTVLCLATLVQEASVALNEVGDPCALRENLRRIEERVRLGDVTGVEISELERELNDIKRRCADQAAVGRGTLPDDLRPVNVEQQDLWSRDEPRYNNTQGPGYYERSVPPISSVADSAMIGDVPISPIAAVRMRDAVDCIRTRYDMVFDPRLMSGDAELQRNAVSIGLESMEEAERLTEAELLQVANTRMVQIQKAVGVMDDIMNSEDGQRLITDERVMEHLRCTYGMGMRLCAQIQCADHMLSSWKRSRAIAQSETGGYSIAVGGGMMALYTCLPDPETGKEKPDTPNGYVMMQALKLARLRGCMRHRGCLWQRIITSDHMRTNAWQRYKTAEEFAYDLTAVPDAELHRRIRSSPSVLKGVIEMLISHKESAVPVLQPDRTVFAFRNGTYLAERELFIAFHRDLEPQLPDGLPCPVACKYHDVYVDPRAFDPAIDPFTIPTPIMDRVMNDQDMPTSVQRCLYAFLGRCIYPLRQHDNWQVFMYILGRAETGKSTFVDFVHSWYNNEDVGVLVDNVEPIFGASQMMNKFIVIADDIGKKFTLPQNIFQMMASGSDVSLAVKGKSVVQGRWTACIIFTGNQLPDYTDNSGSFSRRLVVFRWPNVLRVVDPNLGNSLSLEVGTAIVKCNRLYRNAVRRYAQENPSSLWKFLPKVFETEKKNVQQNSNALVAFLEDQRLAFRDDYYMPKEEFLRMFNEFCKANQMQSEKFVLAYYDTPFRNYKLKMSPTVALHEWPITSDASTPGASRRCVWISGCDTHASAEGRERRRVLLARDLGSRVLIVPSPVMVSPGGGRVGRPPGSRNRQRPAGDDAPRGPATPPAAKRHRAAQSAAPAPAPAPAPAGPPPPTEW